MSKPIKKQSSRLWDLTLVIVLAMLVNGTFVLWLKRGDPAADSELSPLMKRPVLKARGWINGAPPTDEALAAEKLLVINAWATWCGPCRADMPHLVKLHQKYKDRVIFVGLTTEGPEDLPKIKAFLDKTGVEWVNGYGASQTLSALDAHYIPTEYLALPDGTVVAAVNGSDALEVAIEKALETMPPATDTRESAAILQDSTD